MPQRQLWATRHATAIRWEYRLDPLDPDAPSTLVVSVLDQEQKPMETAQVTVPPLVTHEAVADLLHRTWEAWLFGEPGDTKAQVKATGRFWRTYARVHRLTGT